MIEAEIDFEELLAELGATEQSLASDVASALDRDGYAILEETIDRDLLEELRDSFERLWTQQRSATPTSSGKESGTRHVEGLLDRDRVFDRVYTDPRILAAVHYILRCPVRLTQLGGRDPLPGFGQQGLHADWFARTRGEPFRVATALCLLDDFTEQNGATRVVPGTHRLLTPPPKRLAEPGSLHPDQKIITARAGSTLLFNGHLWHSGTRNNTRLSRRVLQYSYVGRNQIRAGKVKCEAPDRLPALARYVAGV